MTATRPAPDVGAASSGITTKSTRTIRWLGAILLVALVLRVGLLVSLASDPARFLQSDAAGYDEIAANIIYHGVFSGAAQAPYVPDAMRTPLYPFFLAAIYAIVGRSYVVVVSVQCLLSLATVHLVFRLGKSISGSTVGLLAALFTALDVGQIIHANLLLTETLYTFLLTVALFPVWELITRGQLRQAVGAGLLLGLGTLCRPVAVYLPLAAALLILLVMRAARRRRLAAVGLMLAAYMLTLAPWLARNLVNFGVPQLTSIQGYNLLYFNASYLRAQLDHTTLEQAQAVLLQDIQPALAGAGDNPFRQEAVYQASALRLIQAHPWLYARLHAQGAALMLVLPNTNFLANMLGILSTPTGLIANLRTRGILDSIRALSQFYRDYLSRSPQLPLFLVALVLEVVCLALAYLLDIVGLWTLLRSKQWPALALLAWPILYFMAVTGPVGYGRYRIPIMPLVAMLAGIGAAAILRRRAMYGVQLNTRTPTLISESDPPRP